MNEDTIEKANLKFSFFYKAEPEIAIVLFNELCRLVPQKSTMQHKEKYLANVVSLREKVYIS